MCACLPVLVAPVQHTGLSVSLSIFSTDSLPPSLPTVLDDTGFQAKMHTRDVYRLCSSINTHVLDVRSEMGTGSCERALGLSSTVGKRRHWALWLSGSHAPPHSHTAAPFPFVYPALPMTLHRHIYCRNTAETWCLRHTCSGGLRVAEGERKGRYFDNQRPLICHPCPQGPLKKQRRHLK